MVHPMVCCYNCQNCAEMVTEYIVFLSDDIKHASAMAQNILNRTRDHLSAGNQDLKKLVFSDGCTVQFKLKLNFFFLSNSQSEVAIERLPMTKVFWLCT